MAQLHNQDDEWGYLLRMQAEKARQEEIELKQEEEMRRRKYKEQLEEMMALNNSRNKSHRKEDAQMMRLLEKNIQAQIDSQKQHDMLLHKQKVEFARDNLKTNEDHIRRQIEGRLRQNRIFQEQYKKQLQQEERNRQIQYEIRKRQKTELAYAYDNKIHQNEYSKMALKKQDTLIAEESQRLEHNKERQRKELLDRIKYGYHQNPETFETYANLMRKKQQDKLNVMSKYIKDEHNPDLETLEKSLFNHDARSPKATGQSNRSSSLTSTALAQIQRDLQEIRLKKQDPHMTEQQLDRMRDVEKKLQFRRSLQLQIEERNHQRLNERRMDNTEVRLNKQAFTGQLMLPGLSTNDYQKLRQREIINNSMGVRARLRTLQEIRPSREQNYNMS